METIFKIIKCSAENPKKPNSLTHVFVKRGRQNFSLSTPVFLHSINYLVLFNENIAAPRIVIDSPNAPYISFLDELKNKKTEYGSKSISYEFKNGINYCVRQRRRILIVSLLPKSLSRVLIVMPCNFSVWAPFWTDYVAHKASISCVILFLAAVSWNLLPLEVPSRWKDCSHFRFSQFSTRKAKFC